MSSILRLCPPRPIVYIVWVNIFFIISTSVGCLAFIFTSCQPFAATWNTLLYVYSCYTGSYSIPIYILADLLFRLVLKIVLVHGERIEFWKSLLRPNNPLPSGHCLPFNDFLINTYVVNTSQMCTDWVSAILPLFIVLPLQMPIRRKLLVASILGLGIFASIAAVARLPIYASTTNDNYLCMLYACLPPFYTNIRA